jgi:hypothetical protein
LPCDEFARRVAFTAPPLSTQQKSLEILVA